MRAKSTKKQNGKNEAVEKFISGAEYSDLDQSNFSHSWENPKIDKNKTRKMTVRIPEEYALKLEFLIEKSTLKTTKQRLILENLMSFIDSEIKKEEKG